MKKDERKREKEEGNRGNLAFRPIMERLIGKALESSEGTSSMHRSVKEVIKPYEVREQRYKRLKIYKSAAILKNSPHIG